MFYIFFIYLSNRSFEFESSIDDMFLEKAFSNVSSICMINDENYFCTFAGSFFLYLQGHLGSALTELNGADLAIGTARGSAIGADRGSVIGADRGSAIGTDRGSAIGADLAAPPRPALFPRPLGPAVCDRLNGRHS